MEDLESPARCAAIVQRLKIQPKLQLKRGTHVNVEHTHAEKHR